MRSGGHPLKGCAVVPPIADPCPLCGKLQDTIEQLQVANAQLLETIARASSVDDGGQTSRAKNLTTEQAAAYSGESVRSLRHLVSTGRLPVVHYGRALRFRRGDLDRLMREGATS